MTDITTIYSMIHWHQPQHIQEEGIRLSKDIPAKFFIQPIVPEFSKNVWDNCALILSKRSDDELTEHLFSLFEWLQDMNWPGAICIYDRLRVFENQSKLQKHIHDCIKIAEKTNDFVWISVLQDLYNGKAL